MEHRADCHQHLHPHPQQQRHRRTHCHRRPQEEGQERAATLPEILHKVRALIEPSRLKKFLNSSLRVAETVWMEGVFLKDYPPEAFTIKCLEVATPET